MRPRRPFGVVRLLVPMLGRARLPWRRRSMALMIWRRRGPRADPSFASGPAQSPASFFSYAINLTLTRAAAAAGKAGPERTLRELLRLGRGGSAAAMVSLRPGPAGVRLLRPADPIRAVGWQTLETMLRDLHRVEQSRPAEGKGAATKRGFDLAWARPRAAAVASAPMAVAALRAAERLGLSAPGAGARRLAEAGPGPAWAARASRGAAARGPAPDAAPRGILRLADPVRPRRVAGAEVRGPVHPPHRAPGIAPGLFAAAGGRLALLIERRRQWRARPGAAARTETAASRPPPPSYQAREWAGPDAALAGLTAAPRPSRAVTAVRRAPHAQPAPIRGGPSFAAARTAGPRLPAFAAAHAAGQLLPRSAAACGMTGDAPPRVAWRARPVGARPDAKAPAGSPEQGPPGAAARIAGWAAPSRPRTVLLWREGDSSGEGSAPARSSTPFADARGRPGLAWRAPTAAKAPPEPAAASSAFAPPGWASGSGATGRQAATPAPAAPPAAPPPDIGRLVDEVVRRLERIGRDERMRRGL